MLGRDRKRAKTRERVGGTRTDHTQEEQKKEALEPNDWEKQRGELVHPNRVPASRGSLALKDH